MLILLRQGRLSKWFSGIGQEAIAVGVAAALQADDPILPLHRNLGVFTGRGLDLLTLFRQLLGRDGGYTGGRDRTFHFGAPAHHVIGMISHLGAMLPVADGMALAFQLKGETRVAAVFSGDGGTSEGDFHEAVNLAAVWKLPVIFIVENNQYGLSTPVSEQYACARLSDRGPGYGIAAETVDGNDLHGGRRRRLARGRQGAHWRGAHAAGVHDLPNARPRRSLRRGLRAATPVRGVGRQGPDRTIRATPARSGRADDDGPRRHPGGVQGPHRPDRRRGLCGARAGVHGGARAR